MFALVNAGSRQVVHDRSWLGGRESSRARVSMPHHQHWLPAFCSDRFLAHYLLYNLGVTPSVQCMDQVAA